MLLWPSSALYWESIWADSRATDWMEQIWLLWQVEQTSPENCPLGHNSPFWRNVFSVLVKVVFEVQLLEIWKSMYPTLNLIDSSALPWSRIELRALGKISEGEELTVSYIDFLNISEERKKQLKRQYYFDCTCEHCQKGLKDDLFLGVKDNPKVHAAHHWSAPGHLPQEPDQGGLPSYPRCPCLPDCGQSTTDGS